MRSFADHWANDLDDRVDIITYDELFQRSRHPVATYIFSDLERLTPTELRIAAQIWDQLERIEDMRLLNNPRLVKRRFELQSALYASGRNDFQVTRASDRNTPLRFPVFLREESRHEGSITPMLHNRTQLDEAILAARFRGHRIDDLLVVEFCDTRDEDSLYRKYAAFRIDDRIIACHIDCSSSWLVKDTDIVSPELVEREKEFIEQNPHEEWVRESFELASIDYGRIDYGILDGKPQVWEINTNPILIQAPSCYQPFHIPVKRYLTERLTPAFEAIDGRPDSDETVAVEIDPKLLARLGPERRRNRLADAHRRMFHTVQYWPIVRFARRTLRAGLHALFPLLARGNGNRPPR